MCLIRVHCMSLTLTAGDLAWGHAPDLGEFQVYPAYQSCFVSQASALPSQRAKQIQIRSRLMDTQHKQHCSQAKNGNWLIIVIC